MNKIITGINENLEYVYSKIDKDFKDWKFNYIDEAFSILTESPIFKNIDDITYLNRSYALKHIFDINLKIKRFLEDYVKLGANFKYGTLIFYRCDNDDIMKYSGFFYNNDYYYLNKPLYLNEHKLKELLNVVEKANLSNHLKVKKICDGVYEIRLYIFLTKDLHYRPKIIIDRVRDIERICEILIPYYIKAKHIQPTLAA